MVWNLSYFSIDWESSSQVTKSIIFQRGGSTTNQCQLCSEWYIGTIIMGMGWWLRPSLQHDSSYPSSGPLDHLMAWFVADESSLRWIHSTAWQPQVASCFSVSSSTNFDDAIVNLHYSVQFRPTWWFGDFPRLRGSHSQTIYRYHQLVRLPLKPGISRWNLGKWVMSHVNCKWWFFHDFSMCLQWFFPDLVSMDWFKGNTYRKTPYFMGKSMVSCRF